MSELVAEDGTAHQASTAGTQFVTYKEGVEMHTFIVAVSYVVLIVIPLARPKIVRPAGVLGCLTLSGI